MKIQKKKNRKKVILIISALCLALILGLGWFYFARLQPSMTTSPNSPKPETSKSNSDSSSSPSSDKHDSSEDTVKNNNHFEEEPSETVGGSSTMNITSLKQSNGLVSAVAIINNVASGGRCIAYFSSDAGTPVTQYMQTRASNKEVTCSVEINETQFAYLGNWTTRIVYTTPDNKKIEATGHLTIR